MLGTSGGSPRQVSGLVRVISAIVSVLALASYVLYQYLPDTFSSTSTLMDVNGPHVVQRAMVSEFMHHQKESHHQHLHQHSMPKYQLSVRQESRQYPFVYPLSRYEHADQAMAAKFRSLIRSKIKIWYDDGRGGAENGHLSLGQETTTNTYVGHTFFFTDYYDKKKVLARYTMRADQVLYVIEDLSHPAPHELKERTDREVQFSKEYALTHGNIPWRHYFGPNGPRPPPIHFMWPAKQIGDVHSISSGQGYWQCAGTAADCQSLHPVHLELEVVSIAPRAFVINNFLSDFEVSSIISSAKSRLHQSSVGDVDTGAFESDVRTSSNAWLSREHSQVTETLFRRAADLLQIDEVHLKRSDSAEDMQVVHYINGQKYDAHHDWGVSGYPESRLVTLLLYLTDQEDRHAGGETSFPKGRDGKGFKIHPGKGNAVLFYNLLEDGNGDDLALHAALPVVRGEKWLANFWVWDPKMKR